jgi:hypothetical protein
MQKSEVGEGAELIEHAIQKRVSVHNRKLGAKDRLQTIGERLRLPAEEDKASHGRTKMA